MANIKISEMAEIAGIPANTQNFLLVGVDTTPLIPVTRKVRFSMIYDYIDNLGLEAYAQANTATTNAATADQRAVTSGSYANSAYLVANTASQRAVTSGLYANSAFDQANTATTDATAASSYANSAYSQANNAIGSSNTVSISTQSAYNTANLSLTYALASNANSLIKVTTAPTSPTGNTGDTSGLVYLSNVALYYCTGAYDGTTNIWSKITSTDTW
jgi:hypothetical protein